MVEARTETASDAVKNIFMWRSLKLHHRGKKPEPGSQGRRASRREEGREVRRSTKDLRRETRGGNRDAAQILHFERF